MLIVKQVKLFYVGLFAVIASGVINSLAAIWATTWTSDFVVHYLLAPEVFKHKLYLPTDTFLLEYLYYLPLLALFGYTATTVIVVIIFNLLIVFGGFFYYYLKQNQNVLILLPLAYLATLSAPWYSFIATPDIRILLLGLLWLWFAFEQRFIFLLHHKRWFVVVTVLLAVSFASDPYFIFVWAIPLFGSYFVVSLLNKKPNNLSTMLCLVTSSVLSVALHFVLNQTPYFTIYRSSFRPVLGQAILANLNFLVLSMEKIFSINSTAGLGNLLVVLFALSGLLIHVVKGIKLKKASNVYPLLSVGLMILAYLFSSRPEDPASARYFIIFPFFAVIGLLVLLNITPKIFKYLLAILLITLCFMNLLQTHQYFRQTTGASYYAEYDHITAVLRAQGVTKAYSGYWRSGITTYRSGNTVTIRQVVCRNGTIVPYLWLASSNWYTANPSITKTAFVRPNTGDQRDNFLACQATSIYQQFGFPTWQTTLEVKDGTVDIFVFDYDISKKLGPAYP